MFNLFRKSLAPAPPTPTFQGRAEASPAPLTSFNAFAGDYGEILACPVDHYLPLLEPQLEELRHELGMDQGDFTTLVRPMLDRFLDRVHLLPASETHHHSRVGGLATHALDVAVQAARASHNVVLDYSRTFTQDLELRAKRKRVWPLAIALTGLLHDLGKPLADQIVVSPDGEVWNPFREGLSGWASSRKIPSYTVQWRAGPRLQRHVPFTLMLVPTILGPVGLAYLTDCGRDVLEAMIVALSGVGDDVIGLKQLVDDADQESTASDRETMRLRWRESAVGGHPVVNRLLEGAKALIAQGRWVPNAVGSPLWIGDAGVYLVWNAAVANILQWLKEGGRAGGIPSDPDRLADFMIDALVAKPQLIGDGTRSLLWSVLFTDAAGRSTPPLEALHIPDPGSILPAGLTWQTAAIAILGRDGQPIVTGAPLIPPPPPGDGLPPLPPVAAAPTPAVPSASSTPQAASAPAAEDPPTSPASGGDVVEAPTTPPAMAPSVADAPNAERAEEASSPDSPPPAEPDTTATPDLSEAAATSGSEVPPTSLGEPLPLESAALASAGALGVFLERVASAIASGDRNVANNVFRKAKLVCLRWPQTATAIDLDPGLIARAVRSNPQWLASDLNGKKLDVATRGITVTLPVNDTAWNSLVINEELSDAFLAIAGKAKRGG